MKVEDKIELQSVAKESCSTYLFMEGKLFLILNTLLPYEPITRPVRHMNLNFFSKNFLNTYEIGRCFITGGQFEEECVEQNKTIIGSFELLLNFGSYTKVLSLIVKRKY